MEHLDESQIRQLLSNFQYVPDDLSMRQLSNSLQWQLSRNKYKGPKTFDAIAKAFQITPKEIPIPKHADLESHEIPTDSNVRPIEEIQKKIQIYNTELERSDFINKYADQFAEVQSDLPCISLCTPDNPDAMRAAIEEKRLANDFRIVGDVHNDPMFKVYYNNLTEFGTIESLPVTGKLADWGCH
jgi:hypothetical protein